MEIEYTERVELHAMLKDELRISNNKADRIITKIEKIMQSATCDSSQTEMFKEKDK